MEVTFNLVKIEGKVKTSNINTLYRKTLEKSKLIHKEQANKGRKLLNKSIPKMKLQENEEEITRFP